MDFKSLEKSLGEKLLTLRDEYGCEGIKSEFENEASDFNDLVFLRYITARAGLKLFIKIGGVEAFTDLKMCIDLIADGVIVPMVESEFALVKSMNMVRDIFGGQPEDFEVVVNIETKTAVENLDRILDAMNGCVGGVTIGRSDLSYSYGMRGQQDSDFTNSVVENIVDKVKARDGLRITVGGGISRKTFENRHFIDRIAPHLTHIETRNVILGSSCIRNPASLEYALDFEKCYLNYKLCKKRTYMKFDEDRFTTLNMRG
jgi:hypothetical protein